MITSAVLRCSAHEQPGKADPRFLVAGFPSSSLAYYLIIHSGHIDTGNGLVAALIMCCPGLATFAIRGLLRIDVATLGWNWRPARYQAWAYVIPILYSLPVYAGVWIFIRGSFDFPAFVDSVGKAFGGNFPRAAAVLATAGRTLYITTEFDAELVLTMGALVLYFWTRHDKVAGKE